MLHLRLLNQVGMALLNKSIHDCPLQHMRVIYMPICSLIGLFLFRRKFMHDVGYIEHTRAAVYTEFVAFSVLFRSTVPTVLIALMVDHLVNMFLRVFTDDLCNLVAPEHLCTNREYREAIRRCSRVRLIRWSLHCFTLFLFRSYFCSFCLTRFVSLACSIVLSAHHLIHTGRF